MANKSNIKLISIILMLVGVGLAYWGYEISGGFSSQLNEALSGSSSDDVMIRYIAAAVSFAAGLFLYLKK